MDDRKTDTNGSSRTNDTADLIKSFAVKAVRYFAVIDPVLFLLSRIRHPSFTFHPLLNILIPAACAAL